MSINKELYERYKAMKAAKLAAQNGQEAPKTGFAALNNPTVAPVEQEQDNLNNGWSTTYSSDYSQPTLTPTPAPTYTPTTPAPTPEPVQESFAPSPIPTQAPVVSQLSLNAENSAEIQQPKLKKYALIGYPLGHSLSAYIHDAGFKSVGINATYEIMPTPPDELSDRIKYLRNNGYSGFNVTIPLKLPVTLFLDEVDVSANIVKAINTVTIDPETNALKGYNTDVTGFGRAIPEDFQLYNKTAAILGTGGAARAAITYLASKQMREFRIYTRNIANSIKMIDYFRKAFPNITFNPYQIDRPKNLSEIDILVNATPIGMSGDKVGFTPIEEDELITLPPHALIYDVIYNPKKTNLIKLGQKHNYKTIKGLDMLIYQAIEAEKIWTGRVPDFKDMKIAALENL